MAKCVICGKEIPENFTVLYMFGTGDVACMKHEGSRELQAYTRSVTGESIALPKECSCCPTKKECYETEHKTNCQNFSLTIKEDLKNETHR